MDATGQGALLRGWSLVLAGRESEVPPLLGAREDAICAAVETDARNEEFKLDSIRLRGWSMFTFALRFAWDMFWNRVVETRTIFLPSRVIAELKRQAQEDLAQNQQHLISVNDVLAAWTARAVATSLPQPRPVTLLTTVNARLRLSSLAQASGVYIQNMVLATYTSLSAKATRGSLGSIALENRRHLTEQLTEPQVLALLRELRSEAQSSGNPQVLCGQSDALLIPFTNWTQADIIKSADFSPALVRTGETGQSRRNPPGSMVFHHANAIRQSPFIRNNVIVLGKDHSDNYWVSGSLLPPTWVKIEEDVKRLSMKSIY
jgi:hypothetical protein